MRFLTVLGTSFAGSIRRQLPIRPAYQIIYWARGGGASPHSTISTPRLTATARPRNWTFRPIWSAIVRNGSNCRADRYALRSVRSIAAKLPLRSEEHTSELQSLMRISYAVFCLKKKRQTTHTSKSQLYLYPTINKKIINYKILPIFITSR